MQIRTTKLQDLLSRAIKGVGNNKNVPITSFIAIELKNGKLTITSSDAVQYLYLMNDVEGDDFYVCVPADQFSKLVARMTSEDISLELKDRSLEVTGNGTYNIPLQTESDGSLPRFADKLTQADDEHEIGEISLSTVKTILNSVKPALATNVAFPQYVNYYMGTDNVIATDTNKMNALKVAALDTPILVSAGMFDLLDVVTDDIIKVRISESTGQLKFTTPTCVICGNVVSGIESFNIDAINSYLNDREYKSSCKLSKAGLLQLIDRISLFVDSIDDNIVTIEFTESGLSLISKQSSGVEVLPYTDLNNFEECSHTINIEYLRDQVKAQNSDILEILFGDDKSIKFVDNDLVSVLAFEE